MHACNRSRGGPPATDPLAVGFVIWAEGAAERGFFVRENEEVADEEKRGGVREQGRRPVKKRGAGEGEGCADVHGIADEAVGATNHQLARRVEGRWSSFADGRESENAPQRERNANASHNHSQDLRRCDCRRADDASPSQNARRQVDEQKADKERGISDCAEDDEHRCTRQLQRILTVRRLTVKRASSSK